MYFKLLILSLIKFSFGQLPGVDPNSVGGAIKGAGLLGALNQQSLSQIFSDPCKGFKTAGNVQTTNQLGNAASSGLSGNVGGLVTNLGQAAKAQQEAKQNEQKCNNFLSVLGIGGAGSNSGTNTNTNTNINSNTKNNVGTNTANSNTGGGLLAALKPSTGVQTKPVGGNPILSNIGGNPNPAANLNAFNP